MPDVSAWLRRFRPRPDARVVLVCLPHAGGNASFFRDWSRLLPPEIELAAVQYPGRVDRLAEPCVDDMSGLAEAITSVLLADARRPFALFGHSLGASVGYEVARRLDRAGTPPTWLFASGRPAPHHQRPGVKHLADDDELWAEAVGLGGIGPELANHPEVRDVALPVLRSDFRIAETYRCPAPVRLSCPVTAFVGDTDHEVARREAMAWADVTRDTFDLRVFPGGHFYFLASPDQLIAELVLRLGAATMTVR